MPFRRRHGSRHRPEAARATVTAARRRPTMTRSSTRSSPVSEQQEHLPQTAELEAEVARLDDRFRRARADLDNYRKRTAKDVERLVAERTDALIGDWLEDAD